MQSKAIVATVNYGPVYQLKRGSGSDVSAQYPMRERLTNIYRWSDVVWLVWLSQAGNQAGFLKYVFRHHIETPDTQRIIVRITGPTDTTRADLYNPCHHSILEDFST